MGLAKQKLHPLKKTNLKLEIEAAVTGAELASFVRSKKIPHFDKNQFWINSMATLGWMKSRKRRKKSKVSAKTMDFWNFLSSENCPLDQEKKDCFLQTCKKYSCQRKNFF